MKDYKIIADSSCDVPQKYRDEYDIDIVPFYYTFDKVTYGREGIDIKLEDFYDLMMKKNYPLTGQPTIMDYADKFEIYASKGQDILCICLTSKFSGSYNSAVNAAEMMKETYPDVKIEVVDSSQGAGGQGLMVLQAVKMREEDYDIEEAARILRIMSKEGEVIFSVSDLDFLVHGGRLGKASSLLGTILNIQPIIAIKDGELQAYNKVRGVKKALKKMVEIGLNNVGEHKDDYYFCVVDSTRHDDAKVIEQLLENEEVDFLIPEHFPMSVCISAHSGPYNVGLAYLKKYDRIK